MIVVHTAIPLDPDRRADALERIASLAERSREEDGTVAYRATTDVADPNVVRFFERYEDVAALEAHVETDHYREWEAALPEFVAGEMETTRFQLDDPPETIRFGVEELSHTES